VSPSAPDRFRTAARAYFAYGIVYLIGGGYLILHGVGVQRSSVITGIEWLSVGVLLVVGIPYLLRRRRRWFEAWVLSRRDFARILTALMAFRAFKVFGVALRPETAVVPAPWGGTLSFRVGAIVFFVVTVTALVFVARAAWGEEPS